MVIEGRTFDQVQFRLLYELYGNPDYVCSPRGQLVKESLGVQVRLENPRARLSTSPARGANYGFAAGEFLWYLRGAEDLESIAYYNPRMREFSDDGVTLNSAYGKRLRVPAFRPFRDKSQWDDVVQTLSEDRDSRRAVMTIYWAGDLERACAVGTKDVPCTLSLQFFIRQSEHEGIANPPRLHLHVNMRSNDAVWGLCNDLFSFTLLQETMMLDLRVKYPDLQLGEYVHSAGSMHLYERHFEMARRIIEEPISEDGGGEKSFMPAIECRRDLEILLRNEKSLRESGEYEMDLYGGAGWLLKRLAEHRIKRDSKAPVRP